MAEVAYNFNNSRQNSRVRSRSRSPREWKRPERRVMEQDPDSDNKKVRLFVSNLPYELRWQDLKDLFREKVGPEVRRVELIDEVDGKPSGNGVVEIMGRDVAKRAIELLHRYELKGRLINVREERERDRQRPTAREIDRDFDRNIASAGVGGIMSSMPGLIGAGPGGMVGGGVNNMMNVLGAMNMAAAAGGGSGVSGSNLNVQLLAQLGIDPSTITNQVFVANLDYKVTRSKMEEVFRIAGNVIEVELKTDADGRSRGMGTVRFEHPMEAVQCIALLNQQMLYDRQIGVRMDKWVDPIMQEIPSRLPAGLKGVGAGFGNGGQPLMNIAQISNMLTLSVLTGQLSLSNMGMMAGNMSALSGLLGMLPGAGGLSGAGLLGSLASALGAGGMVGGASGLMSGIGSGLSGGAMLGMGGDSLGAGNSSLMGSGLGVGSSGFGGVYSGGGAVSDGRGTVDPAAFGPSGARMTYDRGLDFDDRRDRGSMMTSYDRKERGVDTTGRAGEISSIFVKNLPFAYNWQDLMERFNICGEVRTAQIKMDNGQSRGMGTVSFYTPEDARKAVAMMNGARIDGRQIEVHLDRLPA